jgi:anti-anti-sigma regulatory factor
MEPTREEEATAGATALRGAWTVARGGELLTLARAWDAAAKDCTLDCQELERLDTSALQILIAARRALAARGFRLALSNIPENVGKQLRLAGLAEELLA